MSGRLQDKVCLITGAGSGIGAACARRFAREGAAVVLADVDEEAASRLASDEASFVTAATWMVDGGYTAN